jgi:hypothetical protein
MTVKELKKVLKDLPDNTEVTMVYDDDHDESVVERYAIGALYEKDSNQIYINC